MLKIFKELSCERNVWRLILLRMLSFAIAIVIPISVLFWKANGLTMADILLLEACFAISLVGFEFPAGYLADVIGRKRSIVFGITALSVGTITYCFSHGFYSFLIAELVLAAGRAFISGADEALLYDSLLEKGEEFRYGRLLTLNGTLSIGVNALYFVCGGYLALYSLRLPYVIAAVLNVVGVLLALSLRETKRKAITREQGHFGEVVRVLRKSLVEQRELGWMMLATASGLGLGQIAIWFYQPYLEAAGISRTALGWVFASMSLMAAFGAANGRALEKRFGMEWLVVGMLVLICAGYGLAGSVTYWWGFCFLFLNQFARGIGAVAFLEYLNERTTSELRASTLSLKSMFERAVYTLGLLVVAIFANRADAAAVFCGLAVAVGILGMILVSVGPSVRERRRKIAFS